MTEAQTVMGKDASFHENHIAIFTSLGMGHFIPSCELTLRLSQDFQCQVTLILFSSLSSSPTAMPYIQTLITSHLPIEILYLPKEVETLEDHMNQSFIHQMLVKIQKSTHHIMKILQSRNSLKALVVDMMCSHMVQPMKEAGIPTYVFYCSAAALLTVEFHAAKLIYCSAAALLTVEFHAAKLTSQISFPFKDVEFGIQLPGLPPIPGKDMPDALLDPSNEFYEGFLSFCNHWKSADGILVNTFEDLEGLAIKSLQEYGQVPSLYSIGPLISHSLRKESAHGVDCIEWLNAHKACSVVFVSFGSVGKVLSAEQISELAIGLEESGHCFVWALGSNECEKKLPVGFIERTIGKGLVLDSWAAQFSILSHPSVGGFLSHCGWNSIMESIYCGVPVIPWPTFVEQKMNRVLVLEEYGIGVDLRRERDGFVKRNEIERSLREMMEGGGGKKARDKSREMKMKGMEALELGGSSWRRMSNWLDSLCST